jgi:acyl-homoserine-lactone acylase
MPPKLLVVLILLACTQPMNSAHEQLREQADRVTIIRDRWGIPHIYGKTDADVVFGLMYAQCEESFERVEQAYIQRLGRMSETEGPGRLMEDLQMRQLYDTAAAIGDLRKSPDWLKKLLQAFADGINYYIGLHPDKPKLLHHFEPWYPLLFTDGGYISIQLGGITSRDMRELYGDSAFLGRADFSLPVDVSQNGSNGFALSPSKTANGYPLLYINPHVRFYFRTEAHLVSEEGLNAYGAITWGQFFVFQGFNEHAGWMHTSSQADVADVYLEDLIQLGDSLTYAYDQSRMPVQTRIHKIPFIKDGSLEVKTFTTYATHHGPVMGKREGRWLSLKEQNRSMNGLIQSWNRMKANGLAAFTEVMQLRANHATNTIFADDKGNIAYWHGNFMPKRDSSIDWTLPVDGTIKSAEWKGLHPLEDLVQIKNPPSGFIQNCNSSPFSVSGMGSISKSNYPSYMAPDEENFRSLWAIKQLEQSNRITMDALIAIGYSHYLPAFDTLLPPLFAAYNTLVQNDPLINALKEPIDVLRSWDRKSSIESIAATLAQEWAYQVISEGYKHWKEIRGNQIEQYAFIINNTPQRKLLEALDLICRGLERAFGSWKVPWGSINRFQRKNGNLQPGFDDAASSEPVGMASALFGSLPSFEAVWPQTRKGYGIAGNSFTAVVEFGPRLKAKAITNGGQSFDPSSKHFNDQTEGYINGRFRDVYFYREDVEKAAEKKYKPGEEE